MPALLLAAIGLAAVGLAALANEPAGDADTSALSLPAQLGRALFFDPALSASGRLACASCHDPRAAYAAPAAASDGIMQGGPQLDLPGLRAVPSLRYLQGTPRFTRHYYVDSGREREDLGPAGGFMLDGRVDTLAQQALLPWFDPREMANASRSQLAARLRAAPYAALFARAFGLAATDDELLRQGAEALQQFESEDPSFHPYSSRYDRYLAGGERLSAAELRGLRLFADPDKGNCAACHTLSGEAGGRPPLFTDRSYHALGIPRNRAIAANRDPGFFDLGLCGPLRQDLRLETRYCGYFKTPTLRNVARRRAFFHNASMSSLEQVLRFYVSRDLRPELWYPRTRAGALRFDDLPARWRGNVNVSDAPMNRRPGDDPALDAAEISDVVAFLCTLDDAD